MGSRPCYREADGAMVCPCGGWQVVRKSKAEAGGGRHGESLYMDGVFGFFDLPSGPYLAIITDSEERYRGHGLEFR